MDTIKDFETQMKNAVLKEMIGGTQQDIKDIEKEIVYYKHEYNRTHSNSIFFILRGLQETRKRDKDVLNRWVAYKNFSCANRCKTDSQ